MQPESERLNYRLIDSSDAAFMLELMNTEKWLQFIGDRHIHSKEDAEVYINLRMDPDLDVKGFVNYIMIRKSDGKAVGTCSVHNRKGLDGLDVGYALLPEFEGHGYASEGAREMVKLIFNKYKRTKASAITGEKHVGSCSLLEKLGFIHSDTIQLAEDPEKLRLYILQRERWELMH